MRSQSLPTLALFAALALASSASAALVAPYANAAAFQATLQSGSYLETFDGLSSANQPVMLSFSSGGFAYTASAVGGSTLWTGTGNTGSRFLGVENSTNSISFAFISGGPTAIGGRFFNTSSTDTFFAGNVTLTLNDGTTRSFDSQSFSPFLGFISENGNPITSLTLDTTTASGAFISLDDLVVGRAVANAVPESSTYGLVGALVLGFAIWRRRR